MSKRCRRGNGPTDYPLFHLRKNPFMIVIHLLSCGMCSFCASCISAASSKKLLIASLYGAKLHPSKSPYVSVMSALCQRCVINHLFLNFFFGSLTIFMVWPLSSLRRSKSIHPNRARGGACNSHLRTSIMFAQIVSEPFFRFFSPFLCSPPQFTTLLAPFYPHLPGLHHPVAVSYLLASPVLWLHE